MVGHGLEDQLFSWDGWDDNGPMALQFYKVELKVPMGNFPVGSKFSCAMLDGDKSVLQLIDEEEKLHSFSLNLAVGKQLSQEEVDAAYGSKS